MLSIFISAGLASWQDQTHPISLARFGDFRMTLKNGFGKYGIRYLLVYQPMDAKIKTWTVRFPAKENPNMEKALFDWPIVL